MLLGPFLDKSRAVVYSYYFIQFLAVLHAFAKPADFKFPREKVLRLTVGVMTAIEEQLVNSRAPDIAIYFRTYLFPIYFRTYLCAALLRPRINKQNPL